MRITLLFWVVVCIISGCGKHSDKMTNDQQQAMADKSGPTDICWKGALNRKTQVLVHYSAYDKLLVGEAEFIGGNQAPAHLIGEMKNDTTVELLEFEKDGTITGVVHGKIHDRKLSGNWFVYENNHDINISFTKIDTTITPMDIAAKGNVSGDYQYQYGKSGESGHLHVAVSGQNSVSFHINSVTGPPSYNVADVNNGTAELNNNKFIYTVPLSKNCHFEVAMFNDFAVVNYTQGECFGEFGMNATVEGIFIKVK